MILKQEKNTNNTEKCDCIENAEFTDENENVCQCKENYILIKNEKCELLFECFDLTNEKGFENVTKCTCVEHAQFVDEKQNKCECEENYIIVNEKCELNETSNESNDNNSKNPSDDENKCNITSRKINH